MAASASSTTISASQKYDVFLSFRGEDTRNGITNHIYSALTKMKIETYMDEKSLERGHEISPALLSAIERSKISVVILSKDYASSSWCLSELVHILKCHDQRGQVVLPISYEVDPSHVRKQDQGSYKDAFKKHEKKFKDKSEMVREWRDALKAVADIAGLHYNKSSRPETTLVEEVVKVIIKELSRPEIPDDDFKGLVGMQEHYRRIKSLLSIDSSRVRIIGIWGMAGIGKTTIAEAIFTRLSPNFESSYFLKNVREVSEKYGFEKLQDELIAKLLGDEKLNPICLPNRIPKQTKDRLRRTKVLLVLDDVSEKKQLQSLVSDLFCCESRIIVTTRDEGVFRGTTISIDFVKYAVGLLSFEESIELFTLKTFGENCPPIDYLELLKKGIRYVGRNPLAITIWGSHLRSLRNPTKENWEMELEKLKLVPHNDIQKVLRISYDGLNKIEQKIFLDIACFFKSWQRGLVENILNACNLFASTGIDFLVDKSLVTMNSTDDILDMHDLVQQMGWHIVHEESEEAGERSRIWTVEDACYVLNNDKGTSRIEGILLDLFALDEDIYLKPTIFQRMDKLRLLRIYDSRETNKYQVHLESLNCLPQSLRYLEWHWCPLKSLPSNFNPCNLVEIKMPYSQLEQLWLGIQKLDKLKGIDVRNSINLTQIPDLSCAQNLELINVENCSSLLQVPWHIFCNLNKLSDVNLSNCHRIGNFPDRIDARGLKSLNLNGCLNMKIVPDIISGNLVYLNMSSTAIVNLPSSIGSIKPLSKLILMNCKLLKCLPSSISQLTRLEVLYLDGCSSLEKFPELPMNIKEISMSETGIEEVPASRIFELESLRCIRFSGCSNMNNLPGIWRLHKHTIRTLHTIIWMSSFTYPSESGWKTEGRFLLYDSNSYFNFLPSRSNECSDRVRLDQISVDNIITNFREHCLRLATQNVAAKSNQDLTFPELTLYYPGEVVPKWFSSDFQSCDDWSSSVTMPLPANSHSGDMLGFALFAVVGGKSRPLTFDIFCEIKLMREGLPDVMMNSSPNTSSLIFHYELKQVLVWYNHCDMSSLNTSGAKEVSFEFIIKDRYCKCGVHIDPRLINQVLRDNCCNPRLIKCGVHILRASDLEELGIAHHNYNVTEIDEQEYNDSPAISNRAVMAPIEPILAIEVIESNAHVERDDHENNKVNEDSDCLPWSMLLSVWSALLLCFHGESDQCTNDDGIVS